MPSLPSGFPPLIKMQMAELGLKGFVTGVCSGGLGRDCEQGHSNDLMCNVKTGHTAAKFHSSQPSESSRGKLK